MGAMSLAVGPTEAQQQPAARVKKGMRCRSP
jgi:hypothetical protein